jgi:hypothetical protein
MVCFAAGPSHNSRLYYLDKRTHDEKEESWVELKGVSRLVFRDFHTIVSTDALPLEVMITAGQTDTGHWQLVN